MAIKYAQYMWYTPEEFKGQYGSQSGRIGFAFAASNAGIPVELWGQHGDWASFKSQKRYMKSDVESLLSISMAVMKIPIMNEPFAIPFDIRDDESTSTTFDVLDDSIPIVEGVPTYTF
jgi:hypothetical protein